VDDFGNETAVSPILKQFNLERTRIMMPDEHLSPVKDPPIIQWTSPVSGWPEGSPRPPSTINMSYEYTYEYGGTARTELSTPPYYKSVPLGSGDTTGSFIYDGPALDPSKKYVVRVHSSASKMDYKNFTGAGYISMVASSTRFWVNP
jgi:hypothetical protein